MNSKHRGAWFIVKRHYYAGTEACHQATEREEISQTRQHHKWDATIPWLLCLRYLEPKLENRLSTPMLEGDQDDLILEKGKNKTKVWATVPYLKLFMQDHRMHYQPVSTMVPESSEHHHLRTRILKIQKRKRPSLSLRQASPYTVDWGCFSERKDYSANLYIYEKCKRPSTRCGKMDCW